MDHVPRFFQGDSISYLATDGIYVPPDRSWAFGFAVNWLLRTSASHRAFLIIQLAALIAVLMGSVAFFRLRERWGMVAYAGFVLAACLDPMLELYARFYMTDLLACLLFTAYLACLCMGLGGGWRRFVGWLPGMAACMVGAVFTRVAYLPIGLLTVLILGVWSLRVKRPILGRLSVAAMLPLLAAGTLVGANMALFAGRFPGEAFLTKSSGVFLLGTFAPALNAADFRAAGVPVSDGDVALLDLPNYDKRGGQIWGTDDRAAQILVRHRLDITGDYPARLDRICSAIVWHALRRAPMAFARVYLNSLIFYFEPSQWRLFLMPEAGLNRPLPQGFVDFMNRVAKPRITAEVTARRSPVMDAFLWFAPAYSVLLLGGVVAAFWRLLSRRPASGGALAAAGFLASLAAVPLYTVYVIPRYVIAAVLLGYLLCAELMAGHRRESGPEGRRAVERVPPDGTL